MFYICKKKEQSLGVLYGVMDTEDGVVEYYSPRDIIHFVRNMNIAIEGVSFVAETGKWQFKTLKPTSFSATETSSFSEDKQSTDKSSDNDCSYIKIEYSEDLGALDSISSQSELDKIFKPWQKYLDNILLELGLCVNTPYLDFLDGCDCVGYGKVTIPNTNLTISIYTNPAYSTNTRRDMKDGVVLISGIGADINGLAIKDMLKYHFDSTLSDNLLSELKQWLEGIYKSDLVSLNKECLDSDNKSKTRFISEISEEYVTLLKLCYNLKQKYSSVGYKYKGLGLVDDRPQKEFLNDVNVKLVKDGFILVKDFITGDFSYSVDCSYELWANMPELEKAGITNWGIVYSFSKDSYTVFCEENEDLLYKILNTRKEDLTNKSATGILKAIDRL